MKKERSNWRKFEQEVVEALGGRRVRVYRRGWYADVVTPTLLVECKWSDRGLLIRPRPILRTMELARRLGKAPVLAAGTGLIRAGVWLGDWPPIDTDFLRMLDYWYGHGYDVWVIGLSGGDAVVPTTSILGWRWPCHLQASK